MMTVTLKVGQPVYVKQMLSDTQARKWKHAHEAAPIGGSFLPGTEFEIADIIRGATSMTLKLEIPHRTPKSYLKLTGEEFGQFFKLNKG